MISVLLSVYNLKHDITFSIESILNQTYKNFELLIMDDGSEDNTYEVLNDYQKKYKNIKIFKNEKNLGLTRSLNILIGHSRGDFIARQDSDDLSFPNRLEKQLQFIEKFNLDGCTTRALIKNVFSIKPNLSFYIPQKQILKIKNPFIHGSLLIKKNVLLEIGKYDENFYYSQDYKLFSDLIYNNKKIRILKTPLYVLNTQNNISTIHKSKQQFYAKHVKKKTIPNIF